MRGGTALGRASRPPSEQPPHRCDEPGRVLVVDDNADMREYVAGLLAEDYDVPTAVDGLDALDQCRSSARPRPHRRDDAAARRLRAARSGCRRTRPPSGIPVIMLSARAGEEGTIEGLEAGADDYLVKPFSARELLARVRVNLELDRARRVRESLERSETLLDQAQRLAQVGSWEVDLADRHASPPPTSCCGSSAAPRGLRAARVLRRWSRPGPPRRPPIVREALGRRRRPGLAAPTRSGIQPEPGRERLVARPRRGRRGRRRAPCAGCAARSRTSPSSAGPSRPLAAASAASEAAAREHAIADELQRSLLPERTFDLEHLDVATYYRAGVEGTQVGGDWYDVIELGAGRTALVVGDVMGRGVSAAAGMGQLRSAVRAFAKLDLPPSEVLEYLDGMVQDLAGDQIVTCVYAVFDSTDQTLRYANAGHLPLLLARPGAETEKLGAAGPPLGAGFFGQPTEKVQLSPGCTVAFYTDGLVERRERDIDAGIEALAEQLEMLATTDADRDARDPRRRAPPRRARRRHRDPGGARQPGAVRRSGPPPARARRAGGLQRPPGRHRAR